MQVNGVPPKGKELELFPGLRLHLPFGVAYARDEDGSMNLLKPRTSPKLYRDGPFELDDEAETTWKLNSLRSVFSGTIEAPRANAAKAVEENMEDIAKGLTEDQDQSESDEDRYTFGTEEGEGGLTFQANFSTAKAGGSYEKPVTKGNVTLCVVHQRMRVMGFHITVSHLIIGVVDYPQMRYYLASLGIPDEDRRGDILKEEIFPCSIRCNSPPRPVLGRFWAKSPRSCFPLPSGAWTSPPGSRWRRGSSPSPSLRASITPVLRIPKPGFSPPFPRRFPLTPRISGTTPP